MKNCALYCIGYFLFIYLDLFIFIRYKDAKRYLAAELWAKLYKEDKNISESSYNLDPDFEMKIIWALPPAFFSKQYWNI